MYYNYDVLITSIVYCVTSVVDVFQTQYELNTFKLKQDIKMLTYNKYLMYIL